MLGVLDTNAIPWEVVTNKMEYLTIPLLKVTGLLKRARCVVCVDTLREKKPHPAPVLLGCELLNFDVSQTLVVGEGLRDLQAGRAAGTYTAFAHYGHLEPGVMDKGLPGSYQIGSPGEVLQLLNLTDSQF